MSIEQLEELCRVIRKEIISITKENGGHMGSNLGSIETIVAMHYVFDCPLDKFIFDVGHQCYTHKFLTGRYDIMKNLHKDSGTTGFPNRCESEYDEFMAGHASTSLSASIGIASARDLSHEDFYVLNLVGDGSMSGGMIYEALNNLKQFRKFIVILNDNGMSISNSVGTVQKYLSKLLSSRGGIITRNKVKWFFQKLRMNFVTRILKKMVSACFHNNLFEEFGLQYIGVVDGHNLNEIITTFKNVKKYSHNKPVIIHIKTKKGNGYKEAEEDKYKMHSAGNKSSVQKKKTYGNIFGETILQMAESDSRIVAITAAMESSVGLANFAERFPDRFFDVGIAEEHAVTFAAGLACQGLKPYFAVYATFLQRAFDQMYHDVSLQNLPVRFIVDKIGVPGGDGKTHAGLYDMSMFNNFYNFRVLSPLDERDLVQAIHFSSEYSDGPLVIRYPKKHPIEITYEKYNNMNVVRRGEKYLVICSASCMTDTINALLYLNIFYSSTIVHLYDNKYNIQYLAEMINSHDKTIFIDDCCFYGSCANLLKNMYEDDRQSLLHKTFFVAPGSEPVCKIQIESQLAEYGLDMNGIARQIGHIINI